jgi:hypothetical protein
VSTPIWTTYGVAVPWFRTFPIGSKMMDKLLGERTAAPLPMVSFRVVVGSEVFKVQLAVVVSEVAAM